MTPQLPNVLLFNFLSFFSVSFWMVSIAMPSSPLTFSSAVPGQCIVCLTHHLSTWKFNFYLIFFISPIFLLTMLTSPSTFWNIWNTVRTTVLMFLSTDFIISVISCWFQFIDFSLHYRLYFPAYLHAQ